MIHEILLQLLVCQDSLKVGFTLRKESPTLSIHICKYVFVQDAGIYSYLNIIQVSGDSFTCVFICIYN